MLSRESLADLIFNIEMYLINNKGTPEQVRDWVTQVDAAPLTPTERQMTILQLGWAKAVVVEYERMPSGIREESNVEYPMDRLHILLEPTVVATDLDLWIAKSEGGFALMLWVPQTDVDVRLTPYLHFQRFREYLIHDLEVGF